MLECLIIYLVIKAIDRVWVEFLCPVADEVKNDENKR